jgi:hypothetical protein
MGSGGEPLSAACPGESIERPADSDPIACGLVVSTLRRAVDVAPRRKLDCSGQVGGRGVVAGARIQSRAQLRYLLG